MRVVLLPVKELDQAKKRQAPFLSPSQRSRLMKAMLQDVSLALCNSKLAERIVMVTRDRWALQHALTQGWDVITEAEQVSESQSVDRASRLLSEQGAKAVLRLPADIPLLQAEDVDLLLGHASDNLIVPSADGTGTNAIMRCPPDAFPSHFGPGSFGLHMEEAARAGIVLDVVHNERIGLDLDEPSDLIAFGRIGSRTRTWLEIEALDLHGKILNASS